MMMHRYDRDDGCGCGYDCGYDCGCYKLSHRHPIPALVLALALVPVTPPAAG